VCRNRRFSEDFLFARQRIESMKFGAIFSGVRNVESGLIVAGEASKKPGRLLILS
jgi:hypothetical protein